MIQIIKNSLYYLLVIILLFNFSNASFLNINENNEFYDYDAVVTGLTSGVKTSSPVTIPPIDGSTTTTTTTTTSSSTSTTSIPTTTTLTTATLSSSSTTTTSIPTTTTLTTASLSSTTTTGGSTSTIPLPTTTVVTGGSSTTGTPVPSTLTFQASKTAFLVDMAITFNITSTDKSFSFQSYPITVSATNLVESFNIACTIITYQYYVTSVCNFATASMGNTNSPKVLKIVNSAFNRTISVVTYKFDSVPWSNPNQYINITGSGFAQIDTSIISIKDSNNSTLNFELHDTYILANLLGIPGNTNGKFSMYIYSDLVASYQFTSLTPFLIGVTPSILNTADQLTIRGTLFTTSSESVIQLKLNGAQTKTIQFNYIDQNTITIPTTEIQSLSGEAFITFKQTASGITMGLPSNQILISFAFPNITSVIYNLNTDQLVVSGTFLNPQLGITYLNGIVYDIVAPDNTLSTSAQLIYLNPKIYYGQLYLSCLTSNSLSQMSFSSMIAPAPMQLDKIPFRGSKTIYFSGRYLSPVDKSGNQIYKASIFNSNSGETIPCISFNAKYLGLKQLYNVSCTVDKYLSYADLLQIVIVNGSISSMIPFRYAPPTISSVSSTVYGTPGQITISGTSFCLDAVITIGGVNCTNPSLASGALADTVVCSFSSNSGPGYTTDALPVTIKCDSQITTLNSSFLYTFDKPCPTGPINGLICSGPTNGACIATTKECNCNKGFGGFDCSIVIVDLTPPTAKVTTNALTIIDSGSNSGSEGSGSNNGGLNHNNIEGYVRFDIGIIQIREIESYNNDKVVRYIDLKTQSWDQSTTFDDTTNTTNYLYNVTVDNTNIQILIIVNSDQTIQHDFLGDTIELLPNSVKYELSITNWEFAVNLNTIQVLFESKITNDCQQKDGTTTNNNKLLMNGESIRSIEMKTNAGKTLVGTFSNRMKLDNKTVVSEIVVLTNEQLLASDIVVNSTNNGNSFIQAVSIGYFEKKAIIDPSFAVLVDSDNTDNGKLDICGNSISNSSKLVSWKIAVIVVCAAVGVALIFVTTAVTYKKIRNKSLMIDIRMKLSRRG